MTPREQAYKYLETIEVYPSAQAGNASVPVEVLASLLELVIRESNLKLPSTGCNFEEVEHSFIVQALVAANGNQTRAAQLLCMTRDQIRYRMRRFGIPSRFGMPKAE